MINRAVSFAGTVVCGFQILGAECTPGVRPIDPVFRYIVHGNRNPQHACQCDQIGADVAVCQAAMVRTPVCHNMIYICKCALSGEIGHKPCGRPGFVGSGIQGIVNFIRKVYGVSFCNLQQRLCAVEDIQTNHGYRHFCPNAQIFLEEIGIAVRAGNSHGNAAQSYICFIPHYADSNGTLCKAQDFFPDICRNRSVVLILYIMAVNRKCRQTMLCMSCHAGGQIDSAGALCTVESPDCLYGQAD